MILWCRGVLASYRLLAVVMWMSVSLRIWGLSILLITSGPVHRIRAWGGSPTWQAVMANQLPTFPPPPLCSLAVSNSWRFLVQGKQWFGHYSLRARANTQMVILGDPSNIRTWHLNRGSVVLKTFKEDECFWKAHNCECWRMNSFHNSESGVNVSYLLW